MELHCNGRLWPFFKHRTWLEKPARDKHPSLLRTLVDFVLKKFYNIWTRCTLGFQPCSQTGQLQRESPDSRNESWGQCYKTFSVRDLQIFVLSKSVSQTRPEKLTNDKHTSLLRRSVIYGQKKFYNIGPSSSGKCRNICKPEKLKTCDHKSSSPGRH